MLRIEGLTAGYSVIPVLNGVSIKVEQGQFVAIVGPNGAGKTTLFKTISGILRPSAGAITFQGIDLLAVRPARRAHLGIAHVPEGRQVFPSLTVMENLEMGAMTEAGQRDWKSNIDFIFERLIDIRRQSNLTILLVEQRVAEALESADHGYVLEAGRVALEGNNQTLRADDRVRKAYLGM